MKIEVKKKVFWYYRLVAANGKILTRSQTYYNKSNAYRAARKLRDDLVAAHQSQEFGQIIALY